MENLLTVIVTLLVGSPLMAVLTHFFNRRARHAETRLKNIEADQKELVKKRDEVDYYRSTINDLVLDMEALRLAQDETDKRYQENTDGLHRKIDLLTEELDRANQSLETANEGLKTANETILDLRQKVEDGNIKITELQEKITQLLVDRAEKSEARKE